jgi:hypothetical protein
MFSKFRSTALLNLLVVLDLVLSTKLLVQLYYSCSIVNLVQLYSHVYSCSPVQFRGAVFEAVCTHNDINVILVEYGLTYMYVPLLQLYCRYN